MNTMTVTINGKKVSLVLIGTLMDYRPRDFGETFEGSFMDDVWMNPKTREVYVEMTMYDGSLYKYDGRMKIKYVGSKFITCDIEAAYQHDQKKEETFFDSPFVEEDEEDFENEHGFDLLKHVIGYCN